MVAATAWKLGSSCICWKLSEDLIARETPPEAHWGEQEKEIRLYLGR